MTPPATLFHALLRPSVLQILRAAGYHCTRPAVLDCLTDLAARYLLAISQAAARHAAANGREQTPSLVDIRMALEDCGALGANLGDDDVQGAEDLINWIKGPRNAEIRRIAAGSANEEGTTDWLMDLKGRHSKMGEDSKFQGTLLGKDYEHGAILVEGGAFDTIQSWAEHMMKTGMMTLPPSPSLSRDSECRGDAASDSRPPSSGLSSLGDRSIDDDFEFDAHNVLKFSPDPAADAGTTLDADDDAAMVGSGLPSLR